MNETVFQPLDDELSGSVPNNDQLYITEEISDLWQETSLWTNYIANLGYVALIILLPGFLYLTSTNSDPGVLLFLGVVLLTIIFVLSRNLSSYSKNINKAATNSDWGAMELAFSNLRTAYAVYSFFSLCIALILLYLFGTFSVRYFASLLQ